MHKLSHHVNNVSLPLGRLTQGLNHRSACDATFNRYDFTKCTVKMLRKIIITSDRTTPSVKQNFSNQT